MTALARTNMKPSLIPKRNKKEILLYLFREGVIVVKKDASLAEHPELKGIPNLHVMMTLKTLKSHSYVREKFNWQHHYYTLTPEGIAFLRGVLALPPTVVPSTHSRKTRGGEGVRRGEDGFRGDDERPRGRGRRDYGGSGGFGNDQGYSGQQ